MTSRILSDLDAAAIFDPVLRNAEVGDSQSQLRERFLQAFEEPESAQVSEPVFTNKYTYGLSVAGMDGGEGVIYAARSKNPDYPEAYSIFAGIDSESLRTIIFSRHGGFEFNAFHVGSSVLIRPTFADIVESLKCESQNKLKGQYNGSPFIPGHLLVAEARKHLPTGEDVLEAIVKNEGFTYVRPVDGLILGRVARVQIFPWIEDSAVSLVVDLVYDRWKRKPSVVVLLRGGTKLQPGRDNIFESAMKYLEHLLADPEVVLNSGRPTLF